METRIKELLEEKIALLQKRLEMVAKTSRDPGQRKRVGQQLAVLKKDFIRLHNGDFPDSEVSRYLSGDVMDTAPALTAAETDLGAYPILGSIPVEPASPFCREQEINEICSFLNFFEKEYWAAVSDYQLKLEFNTSGKRDRLFNELNLLRVAIKNYLDIISDLDKGAANREYESRLRSMKTKQHMDILLKSGEFVSRLHDFIGYLLDDFRNGGNVILNPEDSLHYDSIHGEKAMEGMNIVDVLEKLFQFLSEFREYLNIPDIKKQADADSFYGGE